ncbi:hypothetical protein CC80DRAFT_412224 [Byssothecium circinans]|uniref:Uncharacterized protein n=1 Tax=Byssothecium circinans TaxID=147558 RepID=A0A6A5TWE8_9PLEO|nr:hypothetical protein CC80DRAFT_412224 [Byssothecium circinans]
MIFTVLPAVVQRRIPTIPSIRRTISGFHSRRSTSKETIQSETPSPGCTSRPGSAQSTSSRTSIDSVEGEIAFQECFSTRPQSSMGTPPTFYVLEKKTGINWRYSNQGVSLATQAYAESHILADRDDETSTILTRQLYIHGLTYLLRGLPSELTPEEIMTLQAATPASVAIVHNEPCNQAIAPFMQETSAAQEPPPNASTLHKIIAITVFQAFVMIEFLLPYLKIFLGHAYRFEREHNLMQRMVNNGLVTADALRRGSLQLSHTICQMNDGKVGQAVNDAMVWLVRGVTGGLQQGITEGFTMMSSERARNQKRLERGE